MTFLVLSLIIIVAYENEENYFIFLGSRKTVCTLNLYIKKIILFSLKVEKYLGN